MKKRRGMKKRKGIFITFEGGEGAGKTTLIEKLTEVLKERGKEVVCTREPGGTNLGEEVRKILLQNPPRGHRVSFGSKAELCLFLAARAQNVEEVILPALKQGKIVFCDRFNDSTIAYQGDARGLGVRKVDAFCQFVSEGLKPDMTILLDLDPMRGLFRTLHEFDRIEAEAIEFHEKVRKAFGKRVFINPKRFRVVNADLSADVVFKRTLKHIEEIL